MNEDLVKDSIINLNAMGYNILYIDNRYYILITIELPSSNKMELYIVGKDISTLLKTTVILNGKQNNGEIMSKISNLPDLKRRYSSNYEYIVYLGI